MIKNLIIFALFIALAFHVYVLFTQECVKPEPYKQNEMVNGCVMQKSGNSWIRTCG